MMRLLDVACAAMESEWTRVGMVVLEEHDLRGVVSVRRGGVG